MSRHKRMPPPQRIYEDIAKQLGFPTPILTEFGITVDAIETAYNHCRRVGLTEQQSEATIKKMWENAGR